MTIEHRLANNAALEKESNRASFTAGPYRTGDPRWPGMIVAGETTESTRGGKTVRAICRVQGNALPTWKGDCRLLTASANSYMAHCADPIKSSEEDLLGEAIEALKQCRSQLRALTSPGDVPELALKVLSKIVQP